MENSGISFCHALAIVNSTDRHPDSRFCFRLPLSMAAGFPSSSLPCENSSLPVELNPPPLSPASPIYSYDEIEPSTAIIARHLEQVAKILEKDHVQLHPIPPTDQEIAASVRHRAPKLTPWDTVPQKMREKIVTEWMEHATGYVWSVYYLSNYGTFLTLSV